MNTVSLKEFKPDKSVRERGILVEALWELVSLLTLRNRLCVSSAIKRSALRIFGAKIGKGVVIKQGVAVKYPWKLAVGHHSWLGEGVWIDNIVSVEIGADVCLSQGAYLCTGNHDWSKKGFSLIAKPIVIEEGVWVGAKAIVGSGVRMKTHSVLTAGSVAVQDTDAYKIYQGNPAVVVKDRVICA
jgi:putative colanic acid biosynthesis acetyltransferase WcaF